MSPSSHTPGPDYNCFPLPWRQDGIEIIAANGEKVGWAETSAWGNVQAEKVARLLAAAPELLEACKTMFSVLKAEGYHKGAMELWEQLIAKAETSSL